MNPYRSRAAPDEPQLLICDGLDPTGAAGLIADARVAQHHGCRATGIATTLLVQTTTALLSGAVVSPSTIRLQLESLLPDATVHAVKIGMVGSAAIAQTIAAMLALTDAPVVWDPILYPTRVDVPLVDTSFGEALAALGPRTTLITPNIAELAFLSRRRVTDLDSAMAAAASLAASLRTTVLVKGGHLAGGDATDVLVQAEGRETFTAPRIANGQHVHGVGGALATAIAAQLARGLDLGAAVRAAKAFVTERLAKPVLPGRGAPAIV
ncbi:MAG TPA: PfkB family carbohydrate kinase [Kofleriaceae bacterium]|jgi:hydroxymethylpyrimidine kinase/phosphomethylpyrimidine kinase